VVVVVAVVLDGAGSPYASTQYDMPASNPVHEAVMDGFYTATLVLHQKHHITFANTSRRTHRLKSSNEIPHSAGTSRQCVDPSLSIHHVQYEVVFGSYGYLGVSSRR
jgi:hypothetical protein